MSRTQKFTSESYNDIQCVELCKTHHALLKHKLYLPNWAVNGAYGEDCECCDDEDVLALYLENGELP